MRILSQFIAMFAAAIICTGCTVKAVGDPKRPITIEAHVVIDIKGLQNTATDIEDFVSGTKPKETLSAH